MKKGGVVFTFGLGIIFFCFQCTSPEIKDVNFYADIGHHLFFDKRLSYNHTKSCASCHDPFIAYTDGYHRSIGADGDIHKRNAPTLLNISGADYFTYSDSTIHSIYQQTGIPLFNRQFTELGTFRGSDAILEGINQDPVYGKLIKQSGKISFAWDDIRKCLEAYCLGLNSYQAKYDKVLAGAASYTPDEKQGAALFFSKTLACSQCHGGKNFNTPSRGTSIYLNNGFFEPDSSHVNRKFTKDLGLFEQTRNPADIGKFKIPTLRNCMLTSPYMHDGSIVSLDSVITVYSVGGNSHINKHPLIRGFALTGLEKRQLIQFLQTLTDTSYLKNNHYTDPF